MAQIECIYCRRHGEQSDEHIVQKGLGGNLVVKDVCISCNGSFSRIDQSLAEFSLGSLTRLMETPRSKPVNLGSTQLIRQPNDDLLLEIRLRNEFDPELLPQLHHRGNGSIYFTSGNTEDKANFLALLQQRIEKGNLSNRKAQEKEARLAMEILPPLAPEEDQRRVVNARHLFAKKRYDHDYTWRPAPEIQDAIVDAIFGKSRS